MKAALHCILIACVASGCSPRSARRDAPPAPASPPKQYAEFSIEDQKLAAAFLDRVHAAGRQADLRERTQPADWITLAYHGQALDGNREVIPLDLTNLTTIQESMFDVLYPQVQQKAQAKHGDGLKTAFFDQKYHGASQLAIRSAIIRELLALGPSDLQTRYLWRVSLMQRPIFAHLKDSGGGAGAAVNRDLRDLHLGSEVPVVPEPRSDIGSTSEYIEECRAQGVPIPPDWPDRRWVRQGELLSTFITNFACGVPYSEVYVCKSTEPPGVSYALIRRTAQDAPMAYYAVISFSYRPGREGFRAGFWDYLAERPRGSDFRVRLDALGDARNGLENCTACHRGENPFIVFPGTALDLRRHGAPGGPYDVPDRRDMWYTPIGPSYWTNPGPLALPEPPTGQLSCLACHNLPRFDDPEGSTGYRSVLGQTCRVFMPPMVTDGDTFAPGITGEPELGRPRFPVGWPPPRPGERTWIRNRLFADHITRLAGGGM